MNFHHHYHYVLFLTCASSLLLLGFIITTIITITVVAIAFFVINDIFHTSRSVFPSTLSHTLTLILLSWCCCATTTHHKSLPCSAHAVCTKECVLLSKRTQTQKQQPHQSNNNTTKKCKKRALPTHTATTQCVLCEYIRAYRTARTHDSSAAPPSPCCHSARQAWGECGPSVVSAQHLFTSMKNVHITPTNRSSSPTTTQRTHVRHRQMAKMHDTLSKQFKRETPSHHVERCLGHHNKTRLWLHRHHTTHAYTTHMHYTHTHTYVP